MFNVQVFFLAVAVTLSTGKIFLTGGKSTEKKAFLMMGASEDAVEWTECTNMKFLMKHLVWITLAFEM